MSRTQISIKLDDDLLKRVDQLAESTGTNRTAVIEMAIKNDLPEQEAFQESMENPVIRAIHKQLTTPAMLQIIAKMASKDVSQEEIEEVLDKAPRQREAGKLRQVEKKRNKQNPGIGEG